LHNLDGAVLGREEVRVRVPDHESVGVHLLHPNLPLAVECKVGTEKNESVMSGDEERSDEWRVFSCSAEQYMGGA
jgi:hypothetical protein